MKKIFLAVLLKSHSRLVKPVRRRPQS